jgi:hypothetical protein
MENFVSEGNLIALQATAFSNIAAGRMVAVHSATNAIYSFDGEAAGASSTARSLGMRFIGILADDVSANQCPIVIYTRGVFDLQLQSAITTAARVGRPVYPCVSGGGLLVSTTGYASGCVPVGTVVGIQSGAAAGLGTSGSFVQVKITPGAFRWRAFGSETGIEQGDNFPPSL